MSHRKLSMESINYVLTLLTAAMIVLVADTNVDIRAGTIGDVG